MGTQRVHVLVADDVAVLEDVDDGHAVAPARVGGDTDFKVTVEVTTPHRQAASDVVQVYLRKETGLKAAQQELAGFDRVELKAGETRKIELIITARQVASVREDGTRSFAPITLL